MVKYLRAKARKKNTGHRGGVGGLRALLPGQVFVANRRGHNEHFGREIFPEIAVARAKSLRNGNPRAAAFLRRGSQATASPVA